MSKKAPPPVPTAGSSWLPFASVGLIGGLFGATITYLVLRPGLPPPAPAPASASMTPPAAPDPTAHLPAPELTAGQTPAQAGRTLGNFYYDHQNWLQAISQYETAIRQGSDDADIRTDLGNAYRFIGRFDDALAQYTRARQMNPAHEFSLFNQGALYLQDLKQPAKAVEIWQEYLARFPAGENVAAARQLIAQAQGIPAGLGVPAPAGAARPSAAEAIILKQLQSGQTRGSPP